MVDGALNGTTQPCEGEPMTTPPLTQHACNLTRTNSHGIVAVCSCGWYGVVWHSFRMMNPSGKRGKRNYTNAEANARAEHAAHVKRDGPLTGRLMPESFTGVVINTKRFGHA